MVKSDQYQLLALTTFEVGVTGQNAMNGNLAIYKFPWTSFCHAVMCQQILQTHFKQEQSRSLARKLRKRHIFGRTLFLFHGIIPNENPTWLRTWKRRHVTSSYTIVIGIFIQRTWNFPVAGFRDLWKKGNRKRKVPIRDSTRIDQMFSLVYYLTYRTVPTKIMLSNWLPLLMYSFRFGKRPARQWSSCGPGIAL